MLPVTLATEDELSETIALRILADYPDLLIGSCLRRGGNGYLRSRMRNFCEIARHGPVLVVTDLDTHACPAALRADWLHQLPPPPAMLLRVAVREIESWLLADHDAILVLLGKPARRRLPDNPDILLNPKDFLLDLAKGAPKIVRQELRADAGAVARQGLGYNNRLCALVRELWHPQRAAERSPSLERTIARVRELAAETGT
jgi:hypothetical protein